MTYDTWKITEPDTATCTATEDCDCDLCRFARRIADGHEICTGCGSEIDPETCHCGSAADVHGYFSGHSPVPMGCRCHLKRDGGATP